MRRYFHAYTAHGCENPRSRFALDQWKAQVKIDWIHTPIHDSALPRLFKDSKRQVPYVKDMVEYACAMAGDGDVVAIVNSDIIPAESLSVEVSACFDKRRTKEAMYSYRRDVDEQRTYTDSELRTNSHIYAGMDFFAATKRWWVSHLPAYPDMLYATEAWDYCMRFLFHNSGGFGAKECRYLIYHVKHDSVMNSEGKKSENYNREIAEPFLKAQGGIVYWKLDYPVDLNPK